MRLCAHCSHQLLNLTATATVIAVSCYYCTICCADCCGDIIYIATIAATTATAVAVAVAVTAVVALVLACAIFGICWHNGIGDEIIRRLQNALGMRRCRITIGAA